MKKKLWLPICLMLIIITIVAVGCEGITSPPSQAPAGGLITQQNTGIWVSGEGKVTVVPDVSTLSLGVEAQEATIAQAQSEASSAMDAVVKELGANGVASKDIQTQQFSISPVRTTDKETGQEVLIGYRVDNMVTAKIRKVEDTGTIIDAVARAGGDYTRINSISFTVDDPAPYLRDARQKAMADAESRAKQLADYAGVKLGDPTYISESGGYVPVSVVRPSYAGGSVPAPAPTPPISPGETEITLTVQVVYAIR